MTIKPKLRSLDGLRGVAALTVVGLHVGERFELPHYTRHAYLAVPFFFTLSGFVIAQAYEDRLRNSQLTLFRFVEIRAIRLYPMLFLGACLSALLGSPWWSCVAAALLAPIAAGAQPLFIANGPEWSLFIEALGNLVHGALLKWLNDKVLAGVVLLCAAFTLWAAVHGGSLEVGWSGPTFLAGVAVFGFSYFTGVALFRLRARGVGPRLATPFWALVLIYLVTSCAPQSVGTLASGLRDAAAALVVFPVLVWLGADCAPSPRLHRGLEVAGALSYPLYITHHVLIARTAEWALHSHLNDRPKYLLGAVVALATVGLAWLFYRYIDVPVREWLSAQAHLRRRQPSAGPA